MERESMNSLQEELSRLREILARKEQDITGLRRERLLLDAVFDGSSDEIMIIDNDYTLRDVNASFLDAYGLNRADAIGRKCYDVKGNSGAPCVREGKICPLERAMETGSRVEVTHEHQIAGGHLKKFLINMYPIQLEGEGIACFVEIAREMTDYLTLIRKLQASEKRFRTILDTATNAILSIDENHQIILFNNAAEKIFGYSRREILGKDLQFLIPPRYGDHRGFVQRFLEKKDSSIIGKTLSLAALRKDGQEFPIELSLSSMEMEGKMTFTAIIRDISEKRFLEKKLLQSERLAAVGQAVAHVAHEIKNPLMIIGGFSSQMKKGLTDEKDINKMGMILEEVSRLERLVAGLGDFTKTYRLVKRMTNINEVIRDVIKIMMEVYLPEKYRFNVILSHDIREINCDPDKLRQVFINVVSNGFEAMAEGGQLTLATTRIPQGVEIRISDEGIGIPEEDLHHIFEPFYTTRERGSGLGLPISYKIVQAHDGDISAVSSPGQGTTFIIRLPTR